MGTIKEVSVPDIGDYAGVEIIEVLVSPGDAVHKEDSLITLESDKASVEIPSPEAGIIKEIRVDLGDKVSEGDVILMLELADEAKAPAPPVEAAGADRSQAPAPLPKGANEPPAPPKESAPAAASAPSERPSPTTRIDRERFKRAHASPAIRRLARELGADLGEIKGTGPKGRILKEDIQGYVKHILTSGGPGLTVAEMPEIDFSQFGEIEVEPLTRINKLASVNLHRNWVRVPHVTQCDEADVTELEEFRKVLNQEYKAQGVKVTIPSFLMKAAVSALKQFPRFNSSLDPSNEHLIIKHYYHIGIAVDTSAGLVVPVIRDVDRKSLVDLARELIEVSARARAGKLSRSDLQGGCFSISSLGGIGGTLFTPIINAPEVAVLGVARASMRPVYHNGAFVPRLILPLSLSYDHRVIDGAAGARFTSYLAALLSDTRRMLL